jgi:hypothetical protein
MGLKQVLAKHDNTKRGNITVRGPLTARGNLTAGNSPWHWVFGANDGLLHVLAARLMFMTFKAL